MSDPASDPASTQPPTRNPAVQHCCANRDRSLQHSRAANTDDYTAKTRAAQAYCADMPDLSCCQNIRGFIACVAQSMFIGAIDAVEGPRLLYAAQVAVNLLRYQPKELKQPDASPLPLSPLPGSNLAAEQR